MEIEIVLMPSRLWTACALIAALALATLAGTARADDEGDTPEPNRVYRCHVCRLELVLDDTTHRLTVTPVSVPVAHKTGDFLPYIGNDVGVLESGSRHVVICVFTAKHYGPGYMLEEAIGRVAELTSNYFAARP